MEDYLIKNKTDFKKILFDTIFETKILVDEYPEISIYEVVYNQLNFMKNMIFELNRVPTDEEQERINIGVIATRNFEDDEPLFSKKLIELDYCFCNYDTFESDID